MKIDRTTIVLAIVCILLIAFNLSRDLETGKGFKSEAEFLDYQNGIGYVFLGKFDAAFPAVISAVENSRNSITFTLANGMKHNYGGFDGYALKVVRLRKLSGGETVFVLRSAEK